jgi:hypothetical protein
METLGLARTRRQEAAEPRAQGTSMTGHGRGVVVGGEATRTGARRRSVCAAPRAFARQRVALLAA